MRVWDYRELEKIKNNDLFIEFINSFIKNHELDETLEVLRASGKCFNPFQPKNLEVVDALTPILENHYQHEKEKIQDFNNTIKNLSLMFQEFYQLRDSTDLTKIPSSRRISSFLISLEIWLGASIEYGNGHFLGRIKEVYPFVLALFNPKEKTILPSYIANETLLGIQDSVAENSGSVLKYLIHENGDLNKIETLPIKDVRKSTEHISLFDKFSTLLNLEQRWRYGNIGITYKDNTFHVTNLEKAFVKAQKIASTRFKNQRVKWYEDFKNSRKNSKINDEAKLLSPNENICEDEIFFCIAIGEFLETHDLEVKIEGVTLAEWIRAYTLIRQEGKKTLKERLQNRVVPPLSLKDWTIFKKKDFWETLFCNHGISSSSASVIIKHLTFNKHSKDLLDCPFIEIKDHLVVIPTIASVIDPSMSLISLFNKKQFNTAFKGEGFEGDILKNLQQAGIYSKKLKHVEDGETYECDAAFILDNDFYLIEAKAFGQPLTIKDYYDLKLKLIGPHQKFSIHDKEDKERSAVEQLKRIATFYEENIDIVRKEFDLPQDWVPNKIYKIILTTSMMGETIFIDNTYVTDHSAFSRFLQRSPLAFQYEKYHFIPKHPDYEGEITTQKLINFLSEPPQIVLGNIKVRELNYSISLIENMVSNPIFDDVLGDFIKLNEKQLKQLGIDTALIEEHLVKHFDKTPEKV